MYISPTDKRNKIKLKSTKNTKTEFLVINKHQVKIIFTDVNEQKPFIFYYSFCGKNSLLILFILEL